jgi:hypothetical protein
MNRCTSFGAVIGAFLLATVVAACGGGGGGGTSSALPSTGAGTNNAPPAAGGTAAPPPTNTGFQSPPPLGSTPTPVPPGATPGPALNGTMQLASGGTYPSYTEVAEAQNSNVVFSCGCTAQAGASLLMTGGTFSIPQTAPATPSAPQPTYTTVPGRNYLIVATNASSSESWALEFLGATPAHNLALAPNATSDVFTAAASLYVYFFAASATDTAFDGWNFNSVLAWVNHLRSSGGANAAEQQLLNDIAAAQAGGRTLYPAAPPWNLGASTNATIAADLNGVQASGDTALPTPCPGGSCTGTPTP